MRAYQDMVFGTAIRLLGDFAEAQDIAQEVFLKAHAHFDSLSRSATVGGWLKTVTRNLALNHLTRHRARWQTFSDLVKPGDETSDPVANLPAPDLASERWDADARHQWVEQGLAQLPALQRVPLVLYHFEELSYEAIAEELDVSLSKVKTDIHRGRQALRRHLLRAQLRPEGMTPDTPS